MLPLTGKVMFQNWFSAMFETKFCPDPLIKNAEVVLNHF